MSIALMAEVWRRDVGGIRQGVLLVYADHANDDGVCWPSAALAAWKLGRHVETVRKEVRELRQLGVLEVVSDAAKGNVPVYRLHLDKLGPKPAFKPERGKREADPPRVSERLTPVSPAADPGGSPSTDLTTNGNHQEPPPPQPPNGGRDRDRAAFREQVEAYAQAVGVRGRIGVPAFHAWASLRRAYTEARPWVHRDRDVGARKLHDHVRRHYENTLEVVDAPAAAAGMVPGQ